MKVPRTIVRKVKKCKKKRGLGAEKAFCEQLFAVEREKNGNFAAQTIKISKNMKTKTYLDEVLKDIDLQALVERMHEKDISIRELCEYLPIYILDRVPMDLGPTERKEIACDYLYESYDHKRHYSTRALEKMIRRMNGRTTTTTTTGTDFINGFELGCYDKIVIGGAATIISQMGLVRRRG